MKLHDSLADNNSILLQAEASTWQGAVKFGVDLLVKVDVVEPYYYRAILGGAEQLGPYFVVMPGLTMPHGRPEGGVKKIDLALMMPKTPLVFNYEDDNPVDILITMVAVDVDAHQEAGIMQIVSFSDNEANFNRLHACCTAQEALDLIDNVTTATV